MELHGKVAVISGGATRLGRAITLALARAGCHVFIHYRRSVGVARETQADAAALGVEAEIYAADLAEFEATEGVIPAARKRFQNIDILINNAAVFRESDSFMSTDEALWEELFSVNLRAPLLLSRAFAAQIPDHRQGKIIHVTDSRVRHAGSDHFAYRLTKGGLWQMTEMMALELAPRITVNGVALGAILPPPGKEIADLQRIAKSRVPLKRHGSAEIVAENILHLLRQDFLTGVVLPIDGGEFS
jgi:NAD(P)-dependent dehydrogenase (short-subunit alcohol dehydrogenase family)